MSEQHTERLRRWASQEEDRDHELHAERVRRTTEPTWTTREGESIPIREMSDRHLRNTIRYLRRNRLALEIREVQRMSACVRTDAGSDGCEEWVDALCDSDRDEALEMVCGVYLDLLVESDRRGLEIGE